MAAYGHAWFQFHRWCVAGRVRRESSFFREHRLFEVFVLVNRGSRSGSMQMFGRFLAICFKTK
jgi:hypothetical protein